MKNKIQAVLIEKGNHFLLVFGKAPTKKQLNKEILSFALNKKPLEQRGSPIQKKKSKRAK